MRRNKKRGKKMKDTKNLQNHPLGFDDPGDFMQLREVFQRANYTGVGINTFRSKKRPSTQEGSPLETLIRLFVYKTPVSLEAMRAALDPMDPKKWCEAGIVTQNGDSVRPLINIAPYGRFLMASDFAPASGEVIGEDIVSNIGGSTEVLAAATIRGPVGKTLNLGTGFGIQALLAAGHSETVAAVDGNPRAIDFATFNAKLNGITNIDFYIGDLFDPVKDSTFDLIVMNPPYVISPEFRAHYRDNKMDQDQLCQKVAGRAPEFLNAGGYFQMTGSWAHVAGEPWPERLAQWFNGVDGDVLVLRHRTFDPSEYTLFWNGGPNGRENWDQVYAGWMDYYRKQHIEAISTGLITVRKKDGSSGWFQCTDAPPELRGALSEDILRTFDAYDFLEKVEDDQKLMNARLRCAPDVRMEHECELTDNGWRMVNAKLRRTRGLCYTGKVGPEIAGQLPAFTGQKSVGDMVHELAARRNVTNENLVPEYLTVMRRMIRRGFLHPVEPNKGLEIGSEEEVPQAEPVEA
jgi:hypothetical protein